MSIYDQLLALGYTDAQIRENPRSSTREIGVITADTPDGMPIVGITYGCDFRSEEERGVSDMYRAFVGSKIHDYVMQPKNQFLIGKFDDVPGGSLILSTRKIVGPFSWGHTVGDGEQWGHRTLGSLDYPENSKPDYYHSTYDLFWQGQLKYSQGMGNHLNEWDKMAELRAYAKNELGLTNLATTKRALYDQIEASPAYQSTATKPNVWPGWFHDGNILVLRADRGIVSDVLRLLYEAGQNGTLAFGGGSQVFGSGMSFYDGNDVGPKLDAERKAQAKWYDEQMAKLEPVKAELKSRGHAWYALGNPRNTKDGTKYWLNGHGRGPGYNRQPFGWYSIPELLAEKFVTDVNTRAE